MQGIRKSYYIGQPNELEILHGIDLTVYPGEFVAIVGESGSGKSTLMNIIGVLDKPTAGEYVLDGVNIHDADDNDLAAIRNRKIGFVFQTYNLIGRQSALKNVELPMLYAGVPAGERTRRAKEWLDRVGMAERMKHQPNELSGGQKQRVAIARAMVNEPALILADEPTGALDSQTSRVVMNLFHELHEKYHKTIVLITHNPELAEECQRVLTLRDGLIVGERKGSRRTCSFLRISAWRLTSVKSNKMRSLLTMLGIIIGIAAVIAIETVGNSMTGSVMDSMSGMGASNISVTVTQKSSSSTSGTSQGVRLRRFMDSQPSDSDLITQDMMDDFMATFPTQVDHIELSQQVGDGTIAKYSEPTTTIKTSVSGANTATLENLGADSQILYGRWLDDEKDAGRKVACVSEKFVEQAVGGTAQEAIGKAVTLTINKNLYTFYIQGVYKYTEDNYSSMFGGSDDDSIQTNFYIPLDVAKSIVGAGAGYQSITVVANGGSVNVTTFVDTVGDFFASYYTRNDSWTASASSLASLLDSMSEMMSTISLGISAIAALSLLVGGIGVMNIMMVSVTERTREIGTRKALGAPASAIRMQFITESVILCLIGGAIGIVLGLGLGAALSKAVGYTARPSLAAIVIAVGFSMAIGVFFGYYPANKAAKLDPIEALRYE